MKLYLSPGLRFSLFWTIASAATWASGVALGIHIGPPRYAILLLCFVGPPAGLGQWLCLRPYVPRASLLILANILGWLLSVITYPCFLLLGGMILSLCQWLVLQQGRPLKTLYWVPVSNVFWIASVCVGFGMHLLLFNGLERDLLAWGLCAALAGTVYGALTGPFLWHKILLTSPQADDPVLQSNSGQ
jgi:hypothetical protein